MSYQLQILFTVILLAYHIVLFFVFSNFNRLGFPIRLAIIVLTISFSILLSVIISYSTLVHKYQPPALPKAQKELTI